MTHYILKFTLLSDASFGSGNGVAGLVDSEVQHDEFGLPYVMGRTLRGMLNAECADILPALPQAKPNSWHTAAHQLFGTHGSLDSDSSILHVGNGYLPQDLRTEIEIVVDDERRELTSLEVLEALTTIRHQTAIDAKTEVALDNSLRSLRVIVRQTTFMAGLHFMTQPDVLTVPLLAACVKAWRRGGLGRNRGLGKLQAMLCDSTGQDKTDDYFNQFKQAVQS